MNKQIQKSEFSALELVKLNEQALEIENRYPQKRSCLLPLLHLIQSVDGYVSSRGIDFCADFLNLSIAEVEAVASFYTMFKLQPSGKYTIGVCSTALCAILGGDEIFETLHKYLGVQNGETTKDGMFTLEKVECNAACDYAPVVMVNWEFLDNQTPESIINEIEKLKQGKTVSPSRSKVDKIYEFKKIAQILAGFNNENTSIAKSSKGKQIND